MSYPSRKVNNTTTSKPTRHVVKSGNVAAKLPKSTTRPKGPLGPGTSNKNTVNATAPNTHVTDPPYTPNGIARTTLVAYTTGSTDHYVFPRKGKGPKLKLAASKRRVWSPAAVDTEPTKKCSPTNVVLSAYNKVNRSWSPVRAKYPTATSTPLAQTTTPVKYTVARSVSKVTKTRSNLTKTAPRGNTTKTVKYTHWYKTTRSNNVDTPVGR